MDKLNINQILNRELIEKKIITILEDFQKSKSNLICKRGIYIYGNPGTGKSMFIKQLLKKKWNCFIPS